MYDQYEKFIRAISRCSIPVATECILTSALPQALDFEVHACVVVEVTAVAVMVEARSDSLALREAEGVVVARGGLPRKIVSTSVCDLGSERESLFPPAYVTWAPRERVPYESRVSANL